ncbi:MAG: glucose 1-dehydrogenase [Alphaproteobacteria bacterium]|nr:glucose 1-dehydrogenase [Alphaproteobacteria bacterium]
MRLKDQIAIVTGAASGFGRGIAEAYVAEGAKVLVADIDENGAQQVARDLGNRASSVLADVTGAGAVQRMVETCLEAFGGLDILVNNAGTSHPNRPMLEVDEAEFDRVFAVNVKSIFHGAHAAVPVLRARGGGSIINVASTAGIRPRPGLTWYNGSKGAAITLTKSMAAELAAHNIRVNAICPVIGATGLLETFMGAPDTPETRARFIATIPMGRMSEPRDIANAAVFLADPSSNFLTGVAMEVDGGRCV